MQFFDSSTGMPARSRGYFWVGLTPGDVMEIHDALDTVMQSWGDHGSYDEEVMWELHKAFYRLEQVMLGAQSLPSIPPRCPTPPEG
jgi:hypothetical protein